MITLRDLTPKKCTLIRGGKTEGGCIRTPLDKLKEKRGK